MFAFLFILLLNTCTSTRVIFPLTHQATADLVMVNRSLTGDVVQFTEDGVLQRSPMKLVSHTLQVHQFLSAQTANIKDPVEYGIQYHDGAIMTGLPKVYAIWYGNWSKENTTKIIMTFLSGFGSSNYLRTQRYMTNNRGQTTATQYIFNPTAKYINTYIYGKQLEDADILKMITKTIDERFFPLQDNAVYVVFTASDVKLTSGFCTDYCGWHSHSLVKTTELKFAFIGHPAACPNSCTSQQVSPNYNYAADGMLSILTHELVETLSDPLFSGWYRNDDGYEVADICAWTYGKSQTLPNGAKYNYLLNGRKYYLQQNYVNSNGTGCFIQQ